MVNIGEFAKLDASITELNSEVLTKLGLVRGDKKLLKVLGTGELTRAFKVTATKFSDTAKAKIEAAGGQAIVA